MVMKYRPTPVCGSFRIETEMKAYRACVGKDLAPEFLGLVTEFGRIIGVGRLHAPTILSQACKTLTTIEFKFLVDYIEGAHKPSTPEEKELCRQQLKRFHDLTGWYRSGSENRRSNFLVKDSKVWLIDLAKAKEPQEVGLESPGWAENVTDPAEFDTFWNFSDRHDFTPLARYSGAKRDRGKRKRTISEDGSNGLG